MTGSPKRFELNQLSFQSFLSALLQLILIPLGKTYMRSVPPL